MIPATATATPATPVIAIANVEYREHVDDVVARDICDALTVHAEVDEHVLFYEA